MGINRKWLLAAVGGVMLSGAASATTFTKTSPAGGVLPAGVTEVGGIVLDLLGLNGSRVVSQLAASSLYRGFANVPENGPPSGSAAGNPLLIGTQTGFSSSIVAGLGGGLQSVSVRFTLSDGDNAPGDFDANQNTLSLNNVSFGDWTSVATQQTSNNGTTLLSSGFGFGDGILSTGFFTLSNVANLATFYASLSTGSVAFTLADTDPYDNFYDFTQGIDGGLINVGSAPVVTPSAVPESSTWAMMVFGFGMVGGAIRRRKAIAAFA